VARKPDVDPIYKTRMRNQADFYSLFTATAELLNAKSILCDDFAPTARLAKFTADLDDDKRREMNPVAQDYFTAARSNSNDTGPRRARTAILATVLNGKKL